MGGCEKARQGGIVASVRATRRGGSSTPVRCQKTRERDRIIERREREREGRKREKRTRGEGVCICMGRRTGGESRRGLEGERASDRDAGDGRGEYIQGSRGTSRRKRGSSSGGRETE